MVETLVAVPPFVLLHLHTEYSLLDGACRAGDLIKRCGQLGMPVVAVTHHGNLFGAIEFYSAAVAPAPSHHRVRFLHGAGHRRDRETRGLGEASYHMLPLAEDLTGYRNLLKLTSRSLSNGVQRRRFFLPPSF